MSDYAIVESGGQQFRGDKQVVAAGADLEKVKVEATVTEHLRGAKVRIFKHRPKKGYRRRAGHRQEQTRLEVTEVKMLTRKPAAKKEPAKKEAEKKEPAKKASTAKGSAAKKPAPRKKKEGGWHTRRDSARAATAATRTPRCSG